MFKYIKKKIALAESQDQNFRKWYKWQFTLVSCIWFGLTIIGIYNHWFS